MKWIPFSLNLRNKLILLISGIVLSLTCILGFFSWQQNYKNLEERFGLVLKHITINTTLQISGSEHNRIVNPQDQRSPEFMKIENLLRGIMEANFLTQDTFYTFRITENGELAFAVMLHPDKFIGDIYNPPARNLKYFEMVKNGEPVFTEIYEDDHGHWISGMAPIFSEGKVVGIVEADFKVESFFQELQMQTLELMLFSLLFLACSLGIGIYLSNGIVKPIRELRDSAIRIIKGDFNFSLEATGKDEVSELKRSFNLMVRALSEKLLMMKYISPHTRRMIELQVRNPEFGAGKLKDVAILFADIRGFTSYSEKREPEIVIKNLNLMLSKQSEIIESFGGDIDKFVGDQVIAVFDGPNAASLAVEASKSIQDMIQENIKNNLFPQELSVGIGLVYGQVMMGNVGSEQRKDFTIIGSTVNLGARICSVAKGHEILASSSFYERAVSKNVSRESFNKKGLLKAKGFSERIPIYSIIQK